MTNLEVRLQKYAAQSTRVGDLCENQVEKTQLEGRQNVDLIVILPFQTRHYRLLAWLLWQNQLEEILVVDSAIFLLEVIDQLLRFLTRNAKLMTQLIENDNQEFGLRYEPAIA